MAAGNETCKPLHGRTGSAGPSAFLIRFGLANRLSGRTGARSAARGPRDRALIGRRVLISRCISMNTKSLVAQMCRFDMDHSGVFLHARLRVPASTCRDDDRSDTLAEEPARRAIVERGIRALQRQRELARRQGLIRND